MIGMKNPPRALSSGPKTSPYPNGMRGLFAWMRARNPVLYNRAYSKITSASLNGLGITAEVAATEPVQKSVADKIRDILLGVSQAYLTAEQMKMQKKVVDAQIARAQAGLPPLDIDMSRYGIGPQATVGISGDTQKLLLWIAAGAGAIYLIPKLLKR